MDKQTSLTDIARIAGVSIATVSYALNGSSEVGEKTRQKIVALAKSLDYHPNRAAQGLRTRQSRLICMLINTFNSMFNGELVDDIREKLAHNGYSLLVIGDGNFDLIDSQLFDAFIIFNYSMSDSALKKLINRTTIPIVMMANELPNKNVNNIVLNNRIAIKHLFKSYENSQHRNICFFIGKKRSYNANIRLSSCIDYLAKNHPEINIEKRSYSGNFEIEPSYAIAKQILQETDYNFFFCLNDMMAYGIYQAAEELKLTIGTDISVVGFDNSPKSGKLYKPKLTTVDSRLNKWSAQVVESILERLASKQELENKTIYIPTRIIHGDSVLEK